MSETGLQADRQVYDKYRDTARQAVVGQIPGCSQTDRCRVQPDRQVYVRDTATARQAGV